jgi:hypothetical protein
MPSLFRFLIFIGILAGVVGGGLVMLASLGEPEPKEVIKPIPANKLRKL